MNTTNAINELCRKAHENALVKGFWPEHSEPQLRANIPEKLALIHSEVSEALDAVRHDYPPSDHLLHYDLFAEEMADICIRVFDLCAYSNVPLGEVIAEKMNYNASRPFKHGKAF